MTIIKSIIILCRKCGINKSPLDMDRTWQRKTDGLWYGICKKCNHGGKRGRN